MIGLTLTAMFATGFAQDGPTGDAPQPGQTQTWNFHMQSTKTVQGYPSFSARYSGPNSLPTRSEVRETVSLDLFSGFRLWTGAEMHVDMLTWQGFGLAGTLAARGASLDS